MNLVGLTPTCCLEIHSSLGITVNSGTHMNKLQISVMILAINKSFLSLVHWCRDAVHPSTQKPTHMTCSDFGQLLGIRNDDYGTLIELHWSVWEHQAWHYAKDIEKVLSLTHHLYAHHEKLMSLIGYWMRANLSWCELMVNQQYNIFMFLGFSHHTNDESQKSSAPPFIPPECYVFTKNTWINLHSVSCSYILAVIRLAGGLPSVFSI